MPKWSKLLSILFADDTTLQASDSNFENLIEFVNDGPLKISNTFSNHKGLMAKVTLFKFIFLFLLYDTLQNMTGSHHSILYDEADVYEWNWWYYMYHIT